MEIDIDILLQHCFFQAFEFLCQPVVESTAPLGADFVSEAVTPVEKSGASLAGWVKLSLG
jgi:hypothetical protein